MGEVKLDLVRRKGAEATVMRAGGTKTLCAARRGRERERIQYRNEKKNRQPGEDRA